MHTDDASAVQVADAVVFSPPQVADGAGIWSLARGTKSLDLNSPYSYLLFCRDFARSSVVAREGDRIAGFITGYLRPDAPDTLFVWQVAVDAAYRRMGLARRMLDHLVERCAEVRYVEATVTPDNLASARLFESFAAVHRAEVARDVLFSQETFPEGHAAEVLFRIGPIGVSAPSPPAG